MKLSHLAGVGAALLIGLAATSSSAVSFDILDYSSNGSGNTADTFASNYGGYTPEGATWNAIGPAGGPPANPLVTPPPGSSSGDFLSPFANTGLEDSQSYFSVGSANGVTRTTLNFADPIQDSFRFLWGSIDSYNEITFGMADDQFKLTGNDIAAALGLDQKDGNYDYVALLEFTGFGDYGGLKQITFKSDEAAFEFGLAAIPLPASVLFLFGGLGGLGGLRFLSRRSDAAAA